MGKAPGNAAVKLSGRIDDFVYRQTQYGLVVARRPRGPLLPGDATEPTPAQVTQQRRFADANLYARKVLADPLARRAYERLARERNRRYDRLVASDYLTPPEIEHVELSGYRGQPGDLIRVLAHDDVEVVAVEVQINTAAGALVEQGFATRAHGVWNYAATTAASGNDFLVVTVTAIDRPGNRTTQKVMYP